MAPRPILSVYYDGACPLCRREIAFYRRRRGADRIAWIDISTARQEDLPDGLTAEAARRRFHARGADGRLYIGGGAFARLWAALPPFRIAGAIMCRAPFRWGLALAYAAFLPLRPALQRLAGGADCPSPEGACGIDAGPRR